MLSADVLTHYYQEIEAKEAATTKGEIY